MGKQHLAALQAALSTRPRSPQTEPSTPAAPVYRVPYRVPPSKQGRAAMVVHVPLIQQRSMRALALLEDTTVQALLSEAITDLLRKHGRPESD